jgi:hypothetical protein
MRAGDAVLSLRSTGEVGIDDSGSGLPVRHGKAVPFSGCRSHAATMPAEATRAVMAANEIIEASG